MSFAKAVLSGTLTSSPEQRFTPNNHAVSSFNIAVENPGNGTRSGENEPFLVRVTCWRGLAETVSTRLAKGDAILVEGKLLMNSFQTQDGAQKKIFEVEASAIDKLPGLPEAITPEFSGNVTVMPSNAAAPASSGLNAPAAASPSSQASFPASTAGFSSEDLMTEDDIPF